MKLLSKGMFFCMMVVSMSFVSPLSASAASLVPCGTTEHPEACTLCHILIGGKGLIDWGMGIMVFVGLALMMISGIMYIISVGDNGRMTTAKGMIEKVLGGLALILCGWLIVNTIIVILARDNMGIGIQKENWYTFTCDSTSTANTGGSAGGAQNMTNSTGVTTGTLDRAEPLIVRVPSNSPVVTTIPSGSTKHVALRGNPDFSRGAIAIESVVQVTVVPQSRIFSSLRVPVAFASSAGLTITPTTITTLEEWQNGLTLTVAVGTTDQNVYTVTLKQSGSLLGTIKVNVVSPASTPGIVSNSTNSDVNDTANGIVLDSDDKPVQATVYCGDRRSEGAPISYRTNANGSVTLSKRDCDAKVPGGVAKVWVACPYGVTSVPTEIPVSQFNGSTFVCVIPGTAGSLKYMTP